MSGKSVSMLETNHTFEKQNTVTVKDKIGYHDVLKCIHCNIAAKRYGFSEQIIFDGRTSYNCPFVKAAKKIRIKSCGAHGKIFSNIIRGSIHEVIDAPKGKDTDIGIWVMGVGEPVVILHSEYEEVV